MMLGLIWDTREAIQRRTSRYSGAAFSRPLIGKTFGPTRKVCPTTRVQRCWVHKTSNVLSKVPKGVQSRAKDDLHQIWMAETREDANKAFDKFLEKVRAEI